jgi:hypothetical protein
MRKIIQHIDQRNWRTLEYFRMLDKQNNLQLNSNNMTLDVIVRYFMEKSRSFSIYIYIYRNRVYNLNVRIYKIFINVLCNKQFNH